MRTTMTRKGSRLGVALGVAVMIANGANGGSLTFDDADSLQGLTVSGDVSIDTSKDRGAKGLEPAGVATVGQRTGGSLRLGPGGKTVWPLRDQDGTGVLELWVYEDAAKPTKPKDYGAGAMWGLMQADGHMAAVGALYAPYLSGAETYAVSTLNPEQQKPWQQVTYLGIRRAPGWHKWTFDFDPDKGMRLLYDDQDVKNFNWNQSKLKGFASVVLFGDATDARQVLWVDDATVTLGPPARVAPVWPPPPRRRRRISRCCRRRPLGIPPLTPSGGTGRAQLKTTFPSPSGFRIPRWHRATKPPGSTSISDCGRAPRRSSCSCSATQTCR